jgi:hypothetical protein
VSSGVTLCHPVSFRREQDVSENGAACIHVYVERCPRIEKVADRMFEGEEAVLHVMGQERGGGPEGDTGRTGAPQTTIAADSATIGTIGMRLHATY